MLAAARNRSTASKLQPKSLTAHKKDHVDTEKPPIIFEYPEKTGARPFSSALAVVIIAFALRLLFSQKWRPGHVDQLSGALSPRRLQLVWKSVACRERTSLAFGDPDDETRGLRM